MTFYNPNIQSNFENDNRYQISLKNQELASYSIIYNVNEGCVINRVEDVKSAYQINYLTFKNKFQQNKLTKICGGFDGVIAEIAIEVFLCRINSLEDFLHLKLNITPEAEKNNILYIGDNLQDFIELLLFSDIANETTDNVADPDFTKLIGETDYYNSTPVFYSLFDRLKLYARLRKDIKLTIDATQTVFFDNKLYLTLKINA